MNLEDQKLLIDKLNKELEALKSQIKQKTKAIKKAQKAGMKLLNKWKAEFGDAPQENSPQLSEEEFKEISPLILTELKNHKTGVGVAKLKARLAKPVAKANLQAALEKLEDSGEIAKVSGRGPAKFKTI